MQKISKREAYEQYNEDLDEMFPLEGIHCNPFSTLLARGDPTAYDCGFGDWLSMSELEIEE